MLLTNVKKAQEEQFGGWEGVNQDFILGPDMFDAFIRPAGRDIWYGVQEENSWLELHIWEPSV